MGWSKVIVTGAASSCSSPRSGLMLTTVGGKGGRVGVGTADGSG
jgi:hypothetical protein